VNHRIRRIAIGLVLSLALAMQISPVAAFTVANDPWKTWTSGGYAHWVVVCEADGYLTPGGTGGSMWSRMHAALDAINAEVNAWGGNLHYSLFNVTCSQKGLQSGQPYVAIEYGISCGGSDGAFLGCEATGASGNPPRAFTAGVDIPSGWATCSGNVCGSWWVGTGVPLVGYYDAYTVYLHELLHASTLLHTNTSLCPYVPPGVGTDANPVMCSTIQTGERRVLEADDLNGLNYWY
jgi:hypothetical protein